MTHLNSVEAKLERARRQMRSLKSEITDRSSELANPIVREARADRELGVFRSHEPAMPMEWSVKVGEFDQNLRSPLDHLVWQLAAAHQNCADRQGGDGCSGRHSRFPIRDLPSGRRFEKQLCGVSDAARNYIRDIQPYRHHRNHCGCAQDRISHGLEVLSHLRNRDQHRHSLMASLRWTGEWSALPHRLSLQPTPPWPGPMYLNRHPTKAAVAVSRDLRNAHPLLITSGIRGGRHLDFALDAYFDGPADENSAELTDATARDTLDRCLESVTKVISRLRQEM